MACNWSLNPTILTVPEVMTITIVVAAVITSSAGAVAKYCRRIIVMSASVCLSVCVSACEWVMSVCLSARIPPESHARSLPIFVHAAYDRGSVLLRQGDEIPKERGCFRNFPPQWQCIVMRSPQITSISSRADHSVAARDRWDCTARAKCNLRLPCCYYYTAKKLKLRRVLQTLCGAFERCSCVRL